MLLLLFLFPLLVLSFDIKDLAPLLSPNAEIITPLTPGLFTEATSRFTSFGRPTASAVVLVASEGDVSASIRFANANNITFFVQNRGHGWNTRIGEKIKDALFINVSRLDHVRVDKVRNRAIVGGGVCVAAFQKALFKAGKEMTVPSCDCIGITGPTLGGGVGRLMGNYGLMLDNALSVRVVLPDGALRTVSSSKEPDLFWALRGAGHNFGVITELTFRVYPESVPGGKHYNLDLYVPRENMLAAFEWLRSYHEDKGGLPKGLSLTLIMANNPAVGPFFLINFVYAGPASIGASIAAPLRALASGIALEAMLDWPDLPAVGGIGLAAALCPKGDRYSMFGIDSKKLDPKLQVQIYDEYASMLKQYPAANGTALLFQAHAQQAMHAVDARTTAFPWRESNLFSVMTLKYVGEALDKPMAAWGKKIRALVRQGSGYDKPRVYVNYAWGDEDLQTRYGYEPWRLAKLRGLKKRYDPEGRFGGYNGIQ